MKEERLPVTSTRMNLKILEERLKSLEKGHLLLKCKGDALQMFFKNLEMDLDIKQNKIRTLFKNAFKILKEAKLHNASIHLFRQHCIKANTLLSRTIEYKFGVCITNYKVKRSAIENNMIHCKCRHLLIMAQKQFSEALELMVEFCGILDAYNNLKKNLEITNKRKNSLEHTMIPRLKASTRYIQEELNETEREDFFRLKKIQNLKQNKL